MFCHVMNEGKRGWKAQRDLKNPGVLAGIPDLLIFWRGITTFIELKTPKGVLSTNQKSVHQCLSATGFAVYVCKSLADVSSALTRSSVPLSATIAA
ncbi:hypothetical protein GRAN_1560 [Granulicella sibirica]|uniref:VRR-NUC domain-containing protein n=1 Tax=Granulicella sibirica TaxID=2479048 RepID=A0A4Q0T6H7_9BACT|nr:hypothetical protein GRAN_1560 [Granulicella sibirica]